MNYDNSHYNKNLKPFARQNRKSMTKAEACLWKYILKNKQLEDIKFLRQRTIDNYIVDFCSLDLKLIIEVDGVTHNIEEINRNDIIRQNNLERKGFKVVSFTDEEVLNRLQDVRVSLLQLINNLQNR
jgi:very-short-patch-repair endonuclease